MGIPRSSDFGGDLSAKDENGRTPLYSATMEEQIEVVKLLVIELEADTDTKTNTIDCALRKNVEGLKSCSR